MVAMMGWGVVGAGASASGGWRKGPWTPEEDKLLSEHVKLHGEGRWSSVSRSTGLSRTGKSCRLRWVNYLRPGLKRGQLTPQEEGIIIELHALWGNKWSTIARYLPGRTDNEIKNYWRTHFKKKEIKSSPKQEKRRAKILKQKPQQQEEEEEEVLEQGDQEDDDHTVVEKVNNIITGGEMMHHDDDDAQGKQENMVLNNMCHTSEDQCLQPMMMYSQLESAYSWANTTSLFMEDDWLWGGLWNL